MEISKSIMICIIIGFMGIFLSLVSASDVSVWQGQYYTGTTFNIGTYEFNFSVYDAPTGGDVCFSNTTTLTTGKFGEWKTEQIGVNSACNNVSKDYYLNININGIDQNPRRRLVAWNFLRKDVNETTSGKLQTDAPIIAPTIQADTQIITTVINATQAIVNNLTTTNYGFFNYLGSLVNRITKLWVVDIIATGNIETSQNVSANSFIGNGSLLTNLPAGGGLIPVYLGSNLTATNAAYTTIFTIALTPGKMNIVKAYLAQSSPTAGVAIQNRAIISESGPIGSCHFVTQTQPQAEAVNNIAVSTNSANTGITGMGLDTNVTFINTVTCTVLADANQKNLIVQFESETAATVTTYAGSYYTDAVN